MSLPLLVSVFTKHRAGNNCRLLRFETKQKFILNWNLLRFKCRMCAPTVCVGVARFTSFCHLLNSFLFFFFAVFTGLGSTSYIKWEQCSTCIALSTHTSAIRTASQSQHKRTKFEIFCRLRFWNKMRSEKSDGTWRLMPTNGIESQPKTKWMKKWLNWTNRRMENNHET